MTTEPESGTRWQIDDFKHPRHEGLRWWSEWHVAFVGLRLSYDVNPSTLQGFTTLRGTMMEAFDPAAGGALALTAGIICFSLVITAVAVAVPLFIFFKVFKGMGNNSKANQQILAYGIPADATVKTLGMGGMTMSVGVSRSLQVQLQLEVRKSTGEAPYTAHLSTMVPELAIPSLQPGSSIPVKVDSNNPNSIAIDLPSMGYV